MSETYDEILSGMQTKFYELAGFKADDASDIGIRLKVLAGEIFSMYTNLDWIKSQMFPQTATDTNLDLHAEQRGLSRKSAVKSTGTLTFSINSAVSYDIAIPIGTICSTPQTDGIRFVTTSSGTILTGSTSVTVYAEAEIGGANSNVSVGSVNVMVTPPSGINSVTNGIAFTGGSDEESDSELRVRLIESYKNIPNGTNAAFYHECALKYSGIQSASVVNIPRGNGTVDVYVSKKGGVPSQALIDEIQADISNLRELNVDVMVKAPTLIQIPVYATIYTKTGYTFSEVQAACATSINDYFNSLCIGDSVLLAHIGKAILETEGIYNYAFDGTICTDETINDTQLAIPGNIVITEG